MLYFIKWEDKNLNLKRLHASLLLGMGFWPLSFWLRPGNGVIHSTVSFACVSAQFGFITNIGAIE